ncbi:hypothetical protein HO173_003923 [Letharia columbiana]|uniref:Uncharacterized protein n=1 Tax=Letharia columbiana TaxID=112416 RepID=A0A8H6FZG1_9LECA|nr:uncharacterized protein HO173_003923 [Letharia columbiana]KAF6237722.1 hypothetical protein HO173_003923 [Letharia columbiana]
MVPSGRGQTVCIDQEANQFQCMPAYSVSFVRCLDAAHEAFNKAVEIFGSTITKDFTKERLQFKALQVLKTSGVLKSRTILWKHPGRTRAAAPRICLVSMGSDEVSVRADLIEDIGACTRTVYGLASAVAQAEQRDIHLEMQELIRRQNNSDAVLKEHTSSVNSSAHLDANQRLSDLQVSQIMTFTSGPCSMDAVKNLQYCTYMRNRNRSRSVPAPKPFWLRPKFQTWKATKDFSLKTIEQDTIETASVVDLLEDLVSQALRLNDALHSERSMAMSCTKFQRAATEIQWLVLLGSVPAGLPPVYIIIDVEAVSPRLTSLDAAVSRPTAFLDFFE